IGAWLLVAIYYFYQYALRSAPSVMMPQLTEAFGVNALAVSAIVGMFYYGYSPFSLVAGTSMDRFGAKRVIPSGAAVVGIGAILFGMAGGSAGQFLVGPIIKSGVSWDRFWIYAGCLGLIISVVLLILLPRETSKPATTGSGAFATLLHSLGRVFRNPQSILFGFISGLLFIPTTIL